jgi:hypothetical protein
MRLAALIALMFVGVGFYATPGVAGASTVALPDCLGRPVAKPTSVTLACADANFRIERIQWTGWGESFAAGKGTGVVNDCEPSCVAGHFHNYPVLLIVTGRQTCPSGQTAYEKVVYAFVGRSPFPQESAGNATQDFPCKPRP